jgi:hypothetical protein
MMKFAINSNGNRHKAYIDGVDISNKTRSVQINIEPTDLPSVTIDLAVTEQQVEHEEADIYFITIDGKKFKLVEVK